VQRGTGSRARAKCMQCNGVTKFRGRFLCDADSYVTNVLMGVEVLEEGARRERFHLPTSDIGLEDCHDGVLFESAALVPVIELG